MSAVETIKSVPDRPMPNGDPSTWLYIDDLPTPPEVQREVEETCRRLGWLGWRRWWNRRFIEGITRELKRIHYFLGKRLVCKETRRGLLVLFAGEPGAPDTLAFRQSIPPEEREQILVMTVFDRDFPDWIHI
jgi:hypothetical protein